MLWIKYDLNNRCQYLSQLINCIDVSFIPQSYFIKNIENEEVLQSNLKSNDYSVYVIQLLNTFVIIGFLYDALKMYAVKEKKMISDYFFNRQNRAKKNQVCLQYWLIIFF